MTWRDRWEHIKGRWCVRVWTCRRCRERQASAEAYLATLQGEAEPSPSEVTGDPGLAEFGPSVPLGLSGPDREAVYRAALGRITGLQSPRRMRRVAQRALEATSSSKRLNRGG